MKGKVKFFNEAKHFGFINGDDGTDYFVHVSQVADNVVLQENDEVEFDGEEGDRGPVAKNVKKA